jgi:thioesterase domain-containing protein
MAAHYIREIKQVQESGPYYLSGVSAGGKIAYEMAVQLQAAGEEVKVLAAIDTVVVTHEDGVGLIDVATFEEAERPQMPSAPVNRTRMQFHFEQMQHQNLSQKFSYLAAVMRRWLYYRFIQPLPRMLADPHMGDPRWTPERRLRWAMQIASDHHVMKPYSGRVVLLRSEEARNKLPDPVPYWEEWVNGEVRLVEIPGDHTTMLIEPHIRTLSRHLTSLLAEVQSQEGRLDLGKSIVHSA